MTKTTKSIIAICAMGIVAMASCKKSSSSSSPASNLAGTWKITQEYIDTNNNGKADANESFIDTSFAHTTITFSSNGTVLTTHYSDIEQGSWELVNNNTYLKLIDTGTNGGITYYNVQTLTSTNMVLKDTAVSSHGVLNWIYFTKQ